MSAFKNLFKGKSIYAQLVGTKEGSWKAEMGTGSRRLFNIGTICKGAALVGLGLMIAGTPLGAAAGLVGLAYGFGVAVQSSSRTYNDPKGLDKFYGQPKSLGIGLKNLALYLVQPF